MMKRRMFLGSALSAVALGSHPARPAGAAEQKGEPHRRRLNRSFGRSRRNRSVGSDLSPVIRTRY